jgi:Ser/Thr protein kinase RdoA (MazF antagonist)
MDYIAIIKQSLEFYDIGEYRNAEKLGGGYVNINFKLTTDDGIYFFRIYKHLTNIKKVEHVNEFLLELSKKGFPVAKPILTRDNKTQLEIDKVIVSISEFIEGEPYDFSEKQFINSAKLLAKFHKETSKMSVSKEHAKILTGCELDYIQHVWTGKDSIESKLSKKPDKTDFDKLLLKAILKNKEHLVFLKKDIPHVRKKKNLSIIHGDIWHGNMIFHGSEVAALIDFDQPKIGSIEYDLVKGVHMFINRHKSPGSDLKKLKRFLKAYKEVFGRIDIEEKEILAFWRQAYLTRLSFFIKRGYNLQEKGEDYSEMETIIRACIDYLEWLRDNEKDIVKAFMQ